MALSGLGLDVCQSAAIGVAVLSVVVVFAVRSYKRSHIVASRSYAVLISGCDSGLGYSLAAHAHSIGLTVVASCLNVHGPGASSLSRICGTDRFHLVQMDVTNTLDVSKTLKHVEEILCQDESLELKALVNNAAVMVFGEFEWQTERQIRQQVEVNVLGTLRVTKAFLPLLRRYRGRVIAVSSHCAHASLPGLSAYGATKGALKSWADSLRVEEAKYGVAVISCVPGSFIDKSNIMARHSENAKEMEDAMSVEDKSFFGNYFHTFHSYLSGLSNPNRPPNTIQDEALHNMFQDALLSRNPSSSYVHAPLRYTIYHFLFKISPVWLRDLLVVRFVQMPSFGRS